MGRVVRSRKICDRCAVGKEAEATTTRQFGIDKDRYEIDLCETHGAMFDREFMGWSRLARPLEDVFAKANTNYFGEKDAARRAAELRAKAQQASEAIVAEAQANQDAQVHQLHAGLKPGERHRNGWLVTPHAAERAEQRGYTLSQLMAAAATPKMSRDSNADDRPYTRIHADDDCAVVVNPFEKVIITVLHRDETKYATTDPATTKQRIAQ